jgi:hypothetical protein
MGAHRIHCGNSTARPPPREGRESVEESDSRSGTQTQGDGGEDRWRSWERCRRGVATAPGGGLVAAAPRLGLGVLGGRVTGGCRGGWEGGGGLTVRRGGEVGPEGAERSSTWRSPAGSREEENQRRRGHGEEDRRQGSKKTTDAGGSCTPLDKGPNQLLCTSSPASEPGPS